MERGSLFEQWVFLQMTAFNHANKKGWRISSFRTDTGAEVDWVLDTGKHLIAVECKWGKNVSSHDWAGLKTFEQFARKGIRKCLVYTGPSVQRFAKDETAYPYQEFFNHFLPSLG